MVFHFHCCYWLWRLLNSFLLGPCHTETFILHLSSFILQEVKKKQLVCMLLIRQTLPSTFNLHLWRKKLVFHGFGEWACSFFLPSKKKLSKTKLRILSSWRFYINPHPIARKMQCVSSKSVVKQEIYSEEWLWRDSCLVWARTGIPMPPLADTFTLGVWELLFAVVSSILHRFLQNKLYFTSLCKEYTVSVMNMLSVPLFYFVCFCAQICRKSLNAIGWQDW